MATSKKIYHAYLRHRANNVDKVERLNYNIVVIDNFDGRGEQTYLEPANLALFATNSDIEVVDGVRFYDVEPFFNSRIGGSY